MNANQSEPVEVTPVHFFGDPRDTEGDFRAVISPADEEEPAPKDSSVPESAEPSEGEQQAPTGEAVIPSTSPVIELDLPTSTSPTTEDLDLPTSTSPTVPSPTSPPALPDSPASVEKATKKPSAPASPPSSK